MPANPLHPVINGATAARIRRLLAAILTVLIVAVGYAEVSRIEPAEAVRRIAAGNAVLVDVREPGEWAQTGIVAGAVPMALSDLRGSRQTWKPFLAANKDRELILYCRSGNRSGQAAALLAAEGSRTSNAGGLRDWITAGQSVRPVSSNNQP